MNQSPLSELEDNCVATIHHIDDDELSLKLLEMGFIPGQPVMIEHRSLSNDPLAVRVAGYMIALRREEAQLIWVEIG